MTAVLPAVAQTSSSVSSVQARVRAAVHGPDGVGKDGPMAHVHTALIELSVRGGAGGKGRSRGPRVHSVRRVGNGVAIEAVATDPKQLLRDLRALGLRQGARAGRLVSGELPVRAIREAAARPALRTLRPSLWTTAIGATTTQGDAALNADVAREQAGTDGGGTKVCVLSDSYNTDADADSTAADDVASGDLPGPNNPNGFATPVDIRQDREENSDTNVSDEGRAMLQIVHDLAPGAALGFHTAFGGQANFAEGIRTLATDADCGILVDDVRYFAQPMFQDGVIAQAVTEVVNDGTAFFSAAGNYADRSYDTAEDATPNQGFIDAGRDGSNEAAPGLRGDLHDFDDAEGATDVYQQLTAPAGERLSISLQWDNAYASACPVTNVSCGAEDDLDLYLLNASADSIVASSETANLGADPVEVIQFQNETGTEQTYNMAITRQTGTPGRVKTIILNDRITIDEFDTESATIYGHPNADGAASVGAVFWFDTSAFRDVEPTLRTISSKGGTPILFDGQGRRFDTPEERRSPDFTAIDGVNNTFFGGDAAADSDAFPNFFGTSAAAPHAGAIAALMRSVDASLSPSEIYQSMEASAIDLTERFVTGRSEREPIGSGYDRFSGAGLVQAPDAAPLPVDLARFTAQQDENAAVLAWRTASETNNAGFAVEHRPPDAAWVDRGPFVDGAGTTQTPQSYRVRVGDLAPGTHRFRLRQIDLDGSTTHSDAVTVTVGLDGAYRLTATGPNPMRNATAYRLTVRQAQPVQAALFDPLGQRVAVVHEGRVAPDTPITLRVEGTALATGVYFLRVRGSTFTDTRTLVRVR